MQHPIEGPHVEEQQIKEYYLRYSKKIQQVSFLTNISEKAEAHHSTVLSHICTDTGEIIFKITGIFYSASMVACDIKVENYGVFKR